MGFFCGEIVIFSFLIYNYLYDIINLLIGGIYHSEKEAGDYDTTKIKE